MIAKEEEDLPPPLEDLSESLSQRKSAQFLELNGDEDSILKRGFLLTPQAKSKSSTGKEKKEFLKLPELQEQQLNSQNQSQSSIPTNSNNLQLDNLLTNDAELSRLIANCGGDGEALMKLLGKVLEFVGKGDVQALGRLGETIPAPWKKAVDRVFALLGQHFESLAEAESQKSNAITEAITDPFEADLINKVKSDPEAQRILRDDRIVKLLGMTRTNDPQSVAYLQFLMQRYPSEMPILLDKLIKLGLIKLQ